MTEHLTADDGVLHRKQIDPLHWPAGALVIQIKLTNRIHAVAKKFDSDGVAHERRKNVHDSATDRELARRADRFLPKVTGVREMLHQEFLRKIIAARDVQAVRVEVSRRRESGRH